MQDRLTERIDRIGMVLMLATLACLCMALAFFTFGCSTPVMRSIEVGYGSTSGTLGGVSGTDSTRPLDLDSNTAFVSFHPFAAWEGEPPVDRGYDRPLHRECEEAGSTPVDTEKGDAATETTSSPLTVPLFWGWTTGDITTLAVAAFAAWKAWIEGRRVYRNRKDRASLGERLVGGNE